MEPAIIRLHPADREFLRKAVRGLERPGRIIETLNIAGRPVEAMLKRLPPRSARIVERAVYSSLNSALDWAVTSLDPEELPTAPELDTAIPRISSVARAHTTTAAVLGGVTGIFGIAFLPFELPMTMAVMMRSIASIARDMGADLEVPETRLECMSVLSLGGPSPAEDAADSSYLTARVGLAFMLRDAGRFIAGRSARQVSDAIARGTAPEIAELLTRVGSRFGYAVTDIASAQLVPVLGAIGGAAINGYFTNYFNRIALYHFGIRKLERLYGRELVEDAYREELANLPPAH